MKKRIKQIIIQYETEDGGILIKGYNRPAYKKLLLEKFKQLEHGGVQHGYGRS